MVRDVAFEAGVLRGGLLLGLMHEREVHDWAMGAFGISASLDAMLADVCLAPVELSAMREALYPVSREAEGTRVAAALLTLCGVAPSSVSMSVADRVQQLQLLRHEFRLTGEIVTGILQFAAHEPASHGASSADAFTTWLDSIRAPGFFRCYFEQETDATAFIAALSSRVSDRTPPRIWLHHDTRIASSSHIVILNEPAWTAAARDHGPLPMASRIPGSPPDLSQVTLIS